MGWILRWGSLWMTFPSVFGPFFFPTIHFGQRNLGLIFSKFVCAPFPQLGDISIHWIWSVHLLSLLCWVFQLKSSWWVLGTSWVPGIWDFLVATPVHPIPLLHTYFQFPDPCTSHPSPPITKLILLFSAFPLSAQISLSPYLPLLTRNKSLAPTE